MANVRRFDGSSDYVRAPTEGLDWVRNKTGITISFWTKEYPTGGGTDQIVQIYSDSVVTTNPWFRVDMDGSGNIVATGKRLFSESTAAVTSTGVNVRDGSWHHVVCAFDFTTPEIRVYIDGALNANSGAGLTTGLTDDQTTARIEVGSGTSAAWRGYGCDVQFWGIAFSDEHAIWANQEPYALGIYAPNSPGGSRADLWLWWKFNESAGSPRDYSGNGYNLASSSGNTIQSETLPSLRQLVVSEVVLPEIQGYVAAPEPSDMTSTVTLPEVKGAVEAHVGYFMTSNVVLPEITGAATVEQSHFAIADVLLPEIQGYVAAPGTAEVTATVVLPEITGAAYGGMGTVAFEQAAALQGMPVHTVQGILESDYSTTEQGVLRAKTQLELGGVVPAYQTYGRSRYGVVRCGTTISNDRNAALLGSVLADLMAIIQVQQRGQTYGVLRCEGSAKPIIEVEKLKLRDSGIYKDPSSLFTLQQVYGDWTTTGLEVQVQQVSKSENLWLLADHPIAKLDGVLVDGVPMTAGWSYISAYVDPTGKKVAMLKFSTSVAGKPIKARIVGRQYITNQIIENPADVVLSILEHIQGYSYDFIDRESLAKYRSSCIEAGLSRFRLLLNDPSITVKEVLRLIALSTNAVHTRDKGRHGFTRREGIV